MSEGHLEEEIGIQGFWVEFVDKDGPYMKSYDVETMRRILDVYDGKCIGGCKGGCC